MMNFTDNYVQYLLDIATEINSLSLFLWKDTIVSRNVLAAFIVQCTFIIIIHNIISHGFCTSLVGEMHGNH